MSVWTDEKIEALKEHFRAGLSTAAIADKLGDGITKNSVIGKLHRLGIASDRKKEPKAAKSAPKPRSSSPRHRPQARKAVSVAPVARTYQPAPLPATPFELPPTEHLGAMAVMGLRERLCKFAIGELGDPNFRFCGAKTEGTASYCAHHHGIVYMPSKDRSARLAA